MSRADLTAWQSAIADVVKSGGLDQDDLRILGDISAGDRSERAAAAFARLEIHEPGEVRACILGCAQAHKLQREFSTIVAAEKAKLAELDALKDAVRRLRAFVKEEITDKPARISRTVINLEAPILCDAADVAAMRLGLASIEGLLASRRTVALQTPPRLGATRKVNGKANEIAALGWFLDGVRHLRGKPNEQAASDLAFAILDLPPDFDRAHKAARTRQQRDWRHPKAHSTSK